jgi:hypothetical protein
MERDGDGDVNGRIRCGPDVLRHPRPSNVSTTWDIKTLHIIKLCNFLSRGKPYFFLFTNPFLEAGSKVACPGFESEELGLIEQIPERVHS